MNLYILSAWSSFLDRADIFFIPCPFKYLTGIDCPGCGFQRSLLLLLKGQWKESLEMYAPTIPILLTVIIVLTTRYIFKMRNDKLIRILYLFTGSVILVSYAFKMLIPHGH
ncbi:DUF2752 domain-containing protein [Pedobacter frigoris]|uniref:DUF2752 domain-containing protein n=1 Tax=Pedobacter frigoris TaxID=2571272 RepID=UPI00292E7049|nr:DUF2752 domain-containing protein [Pedobacter frigoris]